MVKQTPQQEIQPQQKLTTRQAVLAYVKKHKKGVLISDFLKDEKLVTRRVAVSMFLDLFNTGYIKRTKCLCGCSYIYSYD